MTGTPSAACLPPPSGVRQLLEGPRFVSRPADPRISMPMVRGALRITVDGTPIVLGPDHPTTGGYRVIACAVTADLGNLAARRPGTDVRFVRA